MIDSDAVFEAIGRLLLGQRWIFAKTMPEHPHEYTLRKHWSEDDQFAQVVQYIRERGYTAHFRGRPYRQLDVNEHCYWTMGAPIPETVLINRALRYSPAPYDAIAPLYDELFADSVSQAENAELMHWVGDVSSKAVLDIGCGTGLLLDYATPVDYTGIDPSRAMLNRLITKHPQRRHQVFCTPLRSFVGKRYDLVLALFGVASYLEDAELVRIPSLLNPGGRFLLMAYAPGYVPVTHERTGVHVPIRKTLPDLPGATVRHWRNYLVIEGGLCVST